MRQRRCDPMSPWWKGMFLNTQADRETKQTQFRVFQMILNDPVFVSSLSLGSTQACHFHYMNPFLNPVYTWNYNNRWMAAIIRRLSDNIHINEEERNQRMSRKHNNVHDEITTKHIIRLRSRQTGISVASSSTCIVGHFERWVEMTKAR